jgi:hypothetical protein
MRQRHGLKTSGSFIVGTADEPKPQNQHEGLPLPLGAQTPARLFQHQQWPFSAAILDCLYRDLIPTNIPTMIAGFVGTMTSYCENKKPRNPRICGALGILWETLRMVFGGMTGLEKYNTNRIIAY